MTGRRITAGTLITIFIIALIFCMFGSGASAAGEPRFTLEVDSTELSENSSAILKITMTGAPGAELVEITGIGLFESIHIDTSTYTEVIDGELTDVKCVTYIIMPLFTGRYTLGGIVEYNGLLHFTNVVEVKVIEDHTGYKEQLQAVEGIFAETILSDSEIYVGQKTVLAYRVYSRYEVLSHFLLNDFRMEDFITVNVPWDMLRTETAVVEGKEYRKLETQVSFLAPIKPGIYKIPSNELCVYYGPQIPGNIFEETDFSGNVSLLTEQKEITVKPLPVEGQPAGFSWVVGKPEIDAEYSAAEVELGDSVALKVTVSGNCSLEGLDRIIGDDLPGFTVYQSEKRYEEFFENNRYNAVKEFEILLVPNKTGSLSIDPIYLPYFDPESGKYELAEIPGTTITVSGEDGSMMVGTAGSGSAVNTVRIDQISYMPEDEGYLTIRVRNEYLYAGAAVLAVALIITASVWFARKRPGRHDTGLYDIYKKILREKEINNVYNLFNDMIKHRFGISIKASCRDMIAENIPGAGLADMIIDVVELVEDKKSHGTVSAAGIKDKIKKIYRLIDSAG